MEKKNHTQQWKKIGSLLFTSWTSKPNRDIKYTIIALVGKLAPQSGTSRIRSNTCNKCMTNHQLPVYFGIMEVPITGLHLSSRTNSNSMVQVNY